MRLRYSKRAERDLEAIGDWIATDNPARAVTFVEELRDKCRKIAEFPTAFPRVAGMKNVHRSLYRKYLLYYRVKKAGVTVTAIVHGARDQMAHGGGAGTTPRPAH